jgi:hypothetical protein
MITLAAFVAAGLLTWSTPCCGLSDFSADTDWALNKGQSLKPGALSYLEECAGLSALGHVPVMSEFELIRSDNVRW